MRKMIQKTTSLWVVLLMFLTFGFSSPAFGAAAVERGSASPEATLITDVLPAGEVVAAVALHYDAIIDGSLLSPAAFTVAAASGGQTAGRTITKVYTNDMAAVAANGKPGAYVILELSPRDANAGTMVFDSATALSTRLTLDYGITQQQNITAMDGKVFAAAPLPIHNSGENTPVLNRFQKITYRDSAGNALNYRLFEPAAEVGRKYPLVLFFHGIGERGADNALPVLASHGALVWTTPQNQAAHPCFVVAPQCPATGLWTDEAIFQLTLAMIRDVMEKYPIDCSRIYVTGLSMGGFMTWKLIQRQPALFAAALPICGVGDPAAAAVIKDMPIWTFHAADDPAVPVAGSLHLGSFSGVGTRDMVAALQRIGSSAVQYTEYPAGYVAPPLAPNPHASWVLAYGNREAIDWLFQQKRRNKERN